VPHDGLTTAVKARIQTTGGFVSHCAQSCLREAAHLGNPQPHLSRRHRHPPSMVDLMVPERAVIVTHTAAPAT